MRKAFRWAGSIVGTLLMVIGLIDLPGQVGRWLALIRSLGLLNQDAARWLFVIVGIGLVVYANWPRRRAMPLAAAPVPPSPAPPPKQSSPLTALEIFKADFPNTLKYAGGMRMHREKIDIEISWMVCLDFDANSKFVSLFIPSVPPHAEKDTAPHHYSMAVQLAEHIGTFLNELDKDVQISAGGVAQQDIPHSALVFSKRVFLYYENYLSPKEQAALIDLYAAKGFDLQLRGPDYHAFHRLTRR